MRGFLFLLFWICCFFELACVFSQNPQPYFRNYSTEDGLPSPETYHIIQDKEGYIWIATDNGVSRFDGYSFQNFGLKEGLEDPVVFNLQETADGRVWMQTMSGKLYWYKKDSVFSYSNNHLIQQEKQKSYWSNRSVKEFYVTKEGEIYLGLESWGAMRLDKIGTIEHFRGEEHGQVVILDIRDSDFMIANHSSYSEPLVSKTYSQYIKKNLLPPIELHTQDSIVIFEGLYNEKPTGRVDCVVKLKDRSYLVVIGNYTYHIVKNQLRKSSRHIYQLGESKAFLEDQNGMLLQGFRENKGLHLYKSLETYRLKPHEIYLKNHSISSILRDKAGGIWISTIYSGIFYCQNWEQKIYNSNIELPSDNTTAIAIITDSLIYTGLSNGSISKLNINSNSVQSLTQPNYFKYITDVFYDKAKGILWAANFNLSYFENSSWHPIENKIVKGSVYVKKITANNISKGVDKDFIWVSGSFGFGRVNSQTKMIDFRSRDFGPIIRTPAILESSSKNVWVGNVNGLFEFRDSQLITPQPTHPAFQYRVEALGELSDSTLVVGTKGSGVILWKGAHFLEITSDNGLTDDMIENIHIDAKNQIWVGTLQGLNKITLDANGNPTVRIFTVRHGLPSNEINQVRTHKDQVWVATTKGLVNLVERPPAEFSKPPMLQGIEVNGQQLSDTSDVNVPVGENNWIFQYLTINFRQDGDIPYRFRLLPAQPAWTLTKNRRVNFSALQDGRYTFEVQSQNEDGQWSASTIFDFRIRPPFWKTWWFGLLAVSILGGLGYGFYRYRIRQIQNEANIEKKITELERSALRAQMNPHFIFNALNSIQSFINIGDKRAANHYLTRFARLIRSALEHSRVTKIPLEDEIKVLENYLELEKTRFNEGFEYHIFVGEDIETFAMKIPSMLVQPYIENAIVHGLSQKKGIGKVEVGFHKKGSYLLITITDNGIGIKQSLKEKGKHKSLHKSIGMTVTQRRLEMLGGKKGQVLKVEELVNANREVSGTRVTLRVAL